jgi:uncharacterized phage infection (PIP) family protein YhgE
LIDWQRIKQLWVITLALFLLLASPPFTDAVRADEGLSTAAQTFAQTVRDARSVFDEFAQEAETFFSQGADEMRQVLKELPDDLQRLSSETDLVTREQLRSEVTAKQDAVTAYVKSFDDWVAKANAAEKQYNTTVDTARSEFKKYLEQSQKELKAGADKKVDNLKLTLKQTAKAVGALNDSANRVLTGKVPFVPGSFDEQLTALDQTFDTVNQLVTSFAN